MSVLIPKSTGTANPYLSKVTVMQGDITEQAVDAIITLIPKSLEYRGAINQSIQAKVGERLDKFLLEHVYPPKAGDVYAVPGFNLPCKHMIFCAVPDWRTDFDRLDRHLINAVRKSIELSKMMNLKTIAFPPIGSGKKSFPKPRAARLILQGIADRVDEQFDEVRIVCTKKGTRVIFEDRLRALR